MTREQLDRWYDEADTNPERFLADAREIEPDVDPTDRLALRAALLGYYETKLAEIEDR